MITAAIVALDIIVHHGTSGDDWSDSSGNNKGRRREWRWSYVPRWSPRIASNRINRPPQRSEHAGMNPMSSYAANYVARLPYDGAARDGGDGGGGGGVVVAALGV